MRIKLIPLIAIVFLVFGSASLYSQESEPQPKPEATPEVSSESISETGMEILEVTIDSTEGEVEVRHFKEKDWVKAEKGMKLKEGAKISTGFKSKATLLFADNSTVVVKSLTQMTISRFVQEGDKVKSDLKLRIGSVRVKVKENQPVKTDMKISTPNSTASVRGTEIEEVKSSSHFGDTISIDSGKVNYETAEGSIAVEGGETTNQDLVNPIENAIMETIAEIAPAGITPEEEQALAYFLAAVGDLFSDATSETGNPVLAKTESQEEPTQEQIDEYNSASLPPPFCPCPICGCDPCICGEPGY